MTIYKLEFSVRDYECDLEKIVNNGTYFNYLEHARHEFLKTLGVDFAEFHKRGMTLVVVRAELDYKFPLTSGDNFYVTVSLAQEGRIRFVFFQDIYRLPDDKLILQGKITGTCISSSGRPFMPDELKNLLARSTASLPAGRQVRR